MRARPTDGRATRAFLNEPPARRAVPSVESSIVRVVEIGHVNVRVRTADLHINIVLHSYRVPRDDLHAVTIQEDVADENYGAVRARRVKLQERVRINSAATDRERPVRAERADLNGFGRNLRSG